MNDKLTIIFVIVILILPALVFCSSEIQLPDGE